MLVATLYSLLVAKRCSTEKTDMKQHVTAY